MLSSLLNRLRLVPALLAVLAFTGCEDDPSGPGRSVGDEVAVIVNSVGVSLTVFPTEDPSDVATIGLGADGTPVGAAVRGRYAVVPLGTFPFAAVVDLGTRAVVHQVALPDGSGATGAAFVNDSIALVANPALDNVSPINVLRGTARPPIPVGNYPAAIAARDGRVYVLNGNLNNFVPAGPGSISVLDAATLDVTGTIQLSGLSPSDAAFSENGRFLYVVNTGNFGTADGSLSVVDLATRDEVAFVEGFGDFPGSVAVGPDGLVYVGDYSAGILVWNPATQSFVRGPDNPIKVNNVPPVSGLGFDEDGDFYTVTTGDCNATPGEAYRVGADLVIEQTIPAGICAFDISFGFVPPS